MTPSDTRIRGHATDGGTCADERGREGDERESDVPALAEGAYAQQRPLIMAPRPVSQQDLEGIYRAAMRYW